jgi:hypothetical protein
MKNLTSLIPMSLLALAIGCATPGPTKDERARIDGLLSTAEQEIEAAKAAQARRFAPIPLRRAEVELSAARAMADSTDHQRAVEAAQVAEQYARYAKETAQAAAAKERAQLNAPKKAPLKAFPGSNR